MLDFIKMPLMDEFKEERNAVKNGTFKEMLRCLEKNASTFELKRRGIFLKRRGVFSAGWIFLETSAFPV